MLTRSYGSVKVLEPEPEKVKTAIQSLVKKLRAMDEVRSAWLIGSYHRKDFGPFSDVDVVLIIESSSERFLDRPLKFKPEQFPAPLDLFVYTSKEVQGMRQSGHAFWKHVEQEHTDLFEDF